MDTRLVIKDVTHVAILVGLIFTLLFVVTWVGLIKCDVIPGWCDIYWMIIGQPKVLIVYGNEGLGEPELLKALLADPNLLGVHAQSMHISHINLGNLKQYNLVIVERSKTVSTEQLDMFIKYATQGGRLVWTGDAGTELAPGDEPLYEDERDVGAEHIEIGPWARKNGDEMVSFDECLAINYVTTYCEVKPCSSEPVLAGVLVPEPTVEHPLIYGLSPSLKLYVINNQDFGIVKPISGMLSTNVLDIDFGGNLIDPEGESLGSTAPMIVTSSCLSGLGERVAYYAMPPEYFASPDIEEQKYYTLIENMYIGMLKG